MKEMWANYIGGWAAQVINDSKIPTGHLLRTKMKDYAKGPKNQAVVDALAEFDKAVDDFAKHTDLQSRQAAYKEMNDNTAHSEFGHFEAEIIKTMNPSGKTFTAAFAPHAKNLHAHFAKIVSAMSEKKTLALKAIQTLQKGAPERPKTAVPAAH